MPQTSAYLMLKLSSGQGNTYQNTLSILTMFKG